MTLIPINDNLLITEFLNVPFGKMFRFKGQNCKRISIYGYINEGGEKKEINYLKELVVVNKKNCSPINKNLLSP